MIYEYSCDKCEKLVEVIKPVKEYDTEEKCAGCDSIMRRAFAPSKIHLYCTAVSEAYYHHGLGQVVQGDAHARRIAKDKKLIEVGNEKPQKHLKPKTKSYDE